MKYTAKYQLLKDGEPVDKERFFTVNFKDGRTITEDKVVTTLQGWISLINSGTEFDQIKLIEVR